MLQLIKDLCSFKTGVVSDDNELLFQRISKELPISLERASSGETFNGWIVPDNWNVKKAILKHNNKVVFDFTKNTLGVARYSKSFSGKLTLEKLQKHLVSNPSLPDAYMFHCEWQYRPWAADWALVMPHKVRQKLKEGLYEVELVTEFKKGEMLIGSCDVLGSSNKTIIFNSNNCHPHMANDGFAGTAVLIRLMQYLSERKNFYSYKLIIAPEHLGSVFFLANKSKEDINNMVCGIFEEMPGTNAPIKATSTFLGDQMLDKAIVNALNSYTSNYELVPWREGAGNDETVWEAPGYEIPFLEITRCEETCKPFREYHSNLDSPELMQEEKLEEMLLVLKKAIISIEENVTIARKFNGLICLSNPIYDLYMERPDPTIDKNLEKDSEKWGHLLDSFFRYFDGNTSLLDIAIKHNLPFERLRKYIQKYEDKGLVSLKRAEIERKNFNFIKKQITN